MLQHAYLLAKIGADTAENEQHFAEILPIGRCRAGGQVGLLAARLDLADGRLAKLAKLAIFCCRSLQFFGGLVLGCIKTKNCKKISV